MAIEDVGARLRLVDRARFSREARRAARDIDEVGDAAASTARRAGVASRMLTRMQTATRPVGRAMLAAGRAIRTGLALAVPAIGAAGVAMVNMASDAKETRSALETVAKGALPAVDAGLDKLYKTSSLTRQEMEQGAVNFLTMGRGADLTGKKLGTFAADLVGAAGDLGSFFNAAQPEVLDALRSGLSGEAEPLRRFGIFLSDAALNAFALEKGLGKTTQEMTEGEKIALRQQFIMEHLGAAQGDAARTADSFANKSRRLWRDIKDLGTTIGVALLPVAQKMVAWASDMTDRYGPQLTEWAETLPGRIDRLSDAIVRAVDVARPWIDRARELAPVLLGGAAALGVVTVATAVWGAAMALVAAWPMIIVFAVGALIGWLVKLYNTNDTAASKMRVAWMALLDVFMMMAVGIINTTGPVVAAVMTMASATLTAMATMARAVGNEEGARRLERWRDNIDDTRDKWDRFRESANRKLRTQIDSHNVQIAYERLQRLNSELDRTVASKLVSAVGQDTAGSLLRQEQAMAGRYGGGRAAGGPTLPGRWYTVGEYGPERFYQGRGGGFVVPTPRMPAVNVSVKGGDGASVAPTGPVTVNVYESSSPRETARQVAQQVRDELARR